MSVLQNMDIGFSSTTKMLDTSLYVTTILECRRYGNKGKAPSHYKNGMGSVKNCLHIHHIKMTFWYTRTSAKCASEVQPGLVTVPQSRLS